jgi:hypothetical protein
MQKTNAPRSSLKGHRVVMHAARKIILAGSTLALTGTLTVGYIALTDDHGTSHHSAIAAHGSAVSAQHVDLASPSQPSFKPIRLKAYNAGVFDAVMCVTNAVGVTNDPESGQSCFHIGNRTSNEDTSAVPLDQAAQIDASATLGADQKFTVDPDANGDFTTKCYRFDGTTWAGFSVKEEDCNSPDFK